MWTKLLLLLIPIGLREVCHFRFAAARGGRVVGGSSSVLVWNVCHLLLMALAVWDVIHARLWLGGWPGLLLVWTGAALRIWAYRTLRQWYAVRIVLRADQPLVTSGPYGFFRHPLHMGLVLEMTGCFAMHGTWLKACVLAVAVATLIVRNLQEDRALAAHFGGAFAAWRTRAWDVVDLLPRLLRRGRH